MKTDQIRQLITNGIFPVDSLTRGLIETHISWVILLDQFVYKIKKPVQFSFLDFSRLEDRQMYCQRELELNQRLAPEMYLQVLPVRFDGMTYCIGAGTGAIIDYALEMKRMDNTRQMDRLLDAGMVTLEDIQLLAKKLAQFHQSASKINHPLTAESLYVDFADVLKVKDLVINIVGEHAGGILERGVEAAQCFLQKYDSHIEQRSIDGWVIDGHGDLHSSNIFLLDEPVIFDCIEFNDHLRYVDVLDELGFLSMDLDFFGHSKLAEELVRTYQKEVFCIRSAKDEQLLLYYKWYRANVRLKVTLLNMEQHTDEPPELSTVQTINRYFELFETYATALV